jgi:hypothetical protein
VIVTATEIERRWREDWPKQPSTIAAVNALAEFNRVRMEPFIDFFMDLLFWDEYQNHGQGD